MAIIHRKPPELRHTFPYSVAFTEDQMQLVRSLTTTVDKSFGYLIEQAFESYLPSAYGLEWPLSPRKKRQLGSGRTSPIFGVLFNAKQDEVLRYIMRHYHVRFSELVEKAFAHYIPQEYDIPWPTAPRLTKTG